MAQARDLTGERYGTLEVLEAVGKEKYGGRLGLIWWCRCDCGEEIFLHVAQLPYSEGSIRAAKRAGRLLYTCCETCRQKTCPICGDKFSYSHVSHVCPRRDCQRELQRQREAYWQAQAAERYRNDAVYRARVRVYLNAWYQDHADEVQRKRRDRVDAMPPEERERWDQERYEDMIRHYERVKADPVAYADRLARGRARLAERAAMEFFSTAQDILHRQGDQVDE